MKYLMTVCYVTLLFAPLFPAYGQDKPALRLVQTISLSV
jgi:hypothetical protein